MEEVVFEVNGSSSEPYGVVFVKRSETNLSAYCSCRAGENSQSCKHRLSILEGKTDGIVSSNLDQVKIVQSWLAGTDLEKNLKIMRQLESEATRIKKELSFAKKSVSNAMHNK